MEGIAGTYGSRDRHLVRRMLAVLAHRGPDSLDVYSDDKLALGANATRGRREERAKPLALDVRLAAASDSYLFNRELLRTTIAPACSEKASDARLALEMYKAIGVRMFSYIDGAFAIAIVDGDKTILARDHYGLKPLYISGDTDRGSYSSEIKSQQLADGGFSIFPPGKLFVSGAGYRAIPRPELAWLNHDDSKRPPARVHELLVRSVASCLSDSRRFNVLLSGGLDSSVVAAAAAELGADMRSACVGTENSEDLKMARLVADHLGTDHEERVFDMEDMIEALGPAVYYSETFDYPLIRSCIPNYLAAHMFGDRRTVTLCGEGGDEVFAGYDYLFNVKADDALRAERVALLKDGHRTGFQRVDRMTASASLDGRMPIMAMNIVDYGLKLDRDVLLGTKIERSKLVLRKAFAKSLPKQVVWRRKRRFSDGAGSIYSMVGYAERAISDQEFEKESKQVPKGRIRTKEELLYFRMFLKHFPSQSALAAVGYTPRP